MILFRGEIHHIRTYTPLFEREHFSHPLCVRNRHSVIGVGGSFLFSVYRYFDFMCLDMGNGEVLRNEWIKVLRNKKTRYVYCVDIPCGKFYDIFTD